MKGQISVIVPIYNVERYLRQCLESICSQSYRNLEIILVDDGSPDLSGIICNEYANRDSRIKVIHKKNEGLGEARNTGLDFASGEYIYFIDSDDWIESDMLFKLLSSMEENKADFVMSGFKKCSQGFKDVIHRQVKKIQIYQGEEVQKNILLPMVAQRSTVKEDYTINMCVWTNLYKRSIIEKEHIRFLSEREYLSEDICFNLKYLMHTYCAVVIPDTFYCYRYNPVSLTCRYKGSEYAMLINLYNEVSKIVDCIGIVDEPEFRKQRFFLTKTREVLFRLANSDLSIKKRICICKNILSDNTLQRILTEYPLQRYATKYRIPAVLMKEKLSCLTIALFYIGKRIRKRNS